MGNSATRSLATQRLPVSRSVCEPPAVGASPSAFRSASATVALSAASRGVTKSAPNAVRRSVCEANGGHSVTRPVPVATVGVHGLVRAGL